MFGKGGKPRQVSVGGLHKPHPGNSPIVDHTNFTDARPTLGSPSASFNPGAKAGPMPSGPMKYPPGQSREQRNTQRNLSNPNAPY